MDFKPIKKGVDWIVVDYSKSVLHIFRSLVLLFEEADLANPKWGRRWEYVQWMQLLQEVLDLQDHFDSGHAHAMKIMETNGTAIRSGRLESHMGRGARVTGTTNQREHHLRRLPDISRGNC
jgi:hypothetical protein